MTSLRARVAVAGAAESDLGAAAPGMRPVDLMTQASIRALDDCGLRPGDVDGLFAASTQLPMAPLNLGQELGIRPRYTDATNVGGSSFMFHVNHARAAIAAGLCEVALIAYGSTQRLVGRARRERPGARPVGDALRPANARDRLRARRVPPHARVRHDARAACGGRRLSAPLGPAQSRRVVARGAQHRRRPELQDGRRPAHLARLLPGHRRRRGDRGDIRAARRDPAPSSGARARCRRSTPSSARHGHGRPHAAPPPSSPGRRRSPRRA